MNYLERAADVMLSDRLDAFGAVLLEGPKWCGKTCTSRRYSKSEIMLDCPDGAFQNRRLAEISSDIVLEGKTPRLIDEWQEVQPLWDAVRSEVDIRASKGQFILTGSATPNHKGIMHSGAGRISRLRMRPMSLYESKDSSGLVSLKDMIDGKFTPRMTGEVDLRKLMQLIVRGGWPGNLDTPESQAHLLPTQYIDAVVEDDIFRLDGIKRDSRKLRLLLRSLARNESTTVTNKTLKKDIKEIDDDDINIDTVTEYLDIFKRLFIFFNL